MAPRMLSVAAVQSAFGQDMKANLDKVESLVCDAAKQNAQVILPPELFQGIYFPTRQDPKWFETAYGVGDHPCVRALQRIAKTLQVVIPISFFEKDTLPLIGPPWNARRAVRRTSGHPGPMWNAGRAKRRPSPRFEGPRAPSFATPHGSRSRRARDAGPAPTSLVPPVLDGP